MGDIIWEEQVWLTPLLPVHVDISCTLSYWVCSYWVCGDLLNLYGFKCLWKGQELDAHLSLPHSTTQ